MKRNHARIAASGAAVMVPTAASVLVLDATHAISAGATARLVGKINLDHTKQQSRPRTMPIGAYEGGDLYNRGWRNLIRTSIQLLFNFCLAVPAFALLLDQIRKPASPRVCLDLATSGAFWASDFHTCALLRSCCCLRCRLVGRSLSCGLARRSLSCRLARRFLRRGLPSRFLRRFFAGSNKPCAASICKPSSPPLLHFLVSLGRYVRDVFCLIKTRIV